MSNIDFSNIFDSKAALNKFNGSEYNEYQFYLKCKNCCYPPELIIKEDNKNIDIYCNKCNIYENEKIENICNYSSEWITNYIEISCNKKHKHKNLKTNKKNLYYIIDLLYSFFFFKSKIEHVPSCKYCKTCNLFFCQECLDNHQKTNSHEYIELKKLKFNYCYKHEQNYQYFCYKCNKTICNNCLIDHNKHKYLQLELITNNTQKRSSFGKFIENSEEIKKIKYKELFKNINDLKNYNNKQDGFLNVILKEIIQIFCNDLRISIDLVNFAKIIFSTVNKIPKNKENDEIINQYNTLIEIIKKYFSIENLEVFKEIIIEKKNKYILFCDELTKEEKKKLNCNINKILNQNTKNVSDSDKKKDYITNIMESSNIIKKFINIEKIKHPDNYINADNNINNIDNYFSKGGLSKNNDYSLSLLVKSVENNGIEMNVSKKKMEILKKLNLLQFNRYLLCHNKKNIY